MKKASSVDDVVFPDQHYATGLSDIKQCGTAGLETQSKRLHSSLDAKITHELRSTKFQLSINCYGIRSINYLR